MKPEEIIHRYCKDNSALENVLLKHSSDVAKRALGIAEKHPEFEIDKEFLYEAAMLHDIGIVYVDAPAIYCYGTEPYIKHGLLGAELLRKEGLPAHARVAERHTGTGLTREEIGSLHDLNSGNHCQSRAREGCVNDEEYHLVGFEEPLEQQNRQIAHHCRHDDADEDNKGFHLNALLDGVLALQQRRRQNGRGAEDEGKVERLLLVDAAHFADREG